MKYIIHIVFSIFLFSFSIFSQWQPDVRLTYDGAQSYMSNPNKHCIASNGNILHVVWHDQRSNWDIYYKRSTDAGVTWSADTPLSFSTGESHEASLVNSGSILHVVWHDNRSGNWKIYYIRSTDGGTSWGAETSLTNNPARSSDACVAVSGSIVHVVWSDYRNPGTEIYYKRSTDGGISWGTDTRITNDTNYSEQPSVSVSGSIAHIEWWDTRDGNQEIYYKRSTDGGISWGADTRLTNNSGVSCSGTVTVSGTYVHIAWRDERDGNGEIYYKRSSDAGLSWGTDTRLTNSSGYSEAPNITLSGLNAHITWQDDRDGNHEIYCKRSLDGGLSWGSDTRLTNSSGTSVRSFSAVTGTAVHVVWMDDRMGNWEIFYKQDPTGNPGPSLPPLPPNLVSPPNGALYVPSTVRFIWNKSFSAVTYRLQVALDSLFINLVVNDSTLTDSTIVVTNLLVNRYYWWRVNAKNTVGTSPYSAVWRFGTFFVGLNQIGTEVPKEYNLYNNYPNPFNPSTNIRFDVPNVETTRRVIFTQLIVYDLLGREVTTLVNKQLEPGTYEVEFDGTNYQSGIYFYKLETEYYTHTKRMVLVK